MTHLYIQQGSNVETVSILVIKKLYDVALTVPEPEQGETDAAYMSGHISVPHSYKEYVEYLAGKIGEGFDGIVTSVRQNAEGRFLDLTIDVTNSFYIVFEDPEVERVMTLNFGDSTGITELLASVAVGGSLFSGNQTITTFPEYPLFTNINNTGNINFYNSTLESIDLSRTRIIPRFEYSALSIDVNVPNATGFIGDRCFDHSHITSISNLGSVTSLPNGTFRCTWYCLGKVNLPSTCTTLGVDAFRECKTRESIDLQYVTTIGDYAFCDCSNMPYVENYNLTYVPSNCFATNNMQTFDFSNIQTIGDYAFQGKTLTQFNGMTLSIPNLVSIDRNAFQGTGITSILNLGSITEIPKECFYRCSNLTSVNLPNTVTTIGESAFKECTSLTTINLSNVTIINRFSFMYCNSLNTIVLPNVERISLMAFASDTNVNKLTNRILDLGEHLTNFNMDQFCNECQAKIILRGSSVPAVVGNFSTRQYWESTIYVPRNMISSYQADTDGWGRITGRDGRTVFYALEDSPYASTTWYQNI